MRSLFQKYTINYNKFSLNILAYSFNKNFVIYFNIQLQVDPKDAKKTKAKTKVEHVGIDKEEWNKLLVKVEKKDKLIRELQKR